MAIILGVALGLILGGLLICWLSPSSGRASNIFWWIGVALAVVGLILLLTPVLVWINLQLRQMLGVH